ncbi:acyl carrier protein [Azospirillum sp.]|uniref:acyl carrier protein n=1 Tax=Azospirillum sp. TaxID=34012 RepID=UPI002D47021E|nr:acyl carrier protein [Azospirillum sp.]HYD66574.1 acyl carrier protein [Azospirillum sp.]
MLTIPTLCRPPVVDEAMTESVAPDTAAEVRRYIVDTFLLGTPGGLSDGQSLMDTGVVDSTGMMAVVAFVEDHFGITVEDEEMVPEVFDTIVRIAAFVDRKRAA